MLRTIAGIILGYLIFAVPSYLLFRLCAMWVALTMVVILAASAISSMVATGVNWSPIAALICMVPAAVAGGRLLLTTTLSQRQRSYVMKQLLV